jgi:hypothetical protein
VERITGYEIRKVGYIAEDGTEHYDTQVYEAATKNACVDYAKKNNLDRNDHFIQAIGYEVISGLRVPTSIGNETYLSNIDY